MKPQLNCWIYVLRHPCMSGLLKIGWTGRTVGVRKAELEAPTGVPGPFVLVWQMQVYAKTVEGEAHRRFCQSSRRRLANRR